MVGTRRAFCHRDRGLTTCTTAALPCYPGIEPSGGGQLPHAQVRVDIGVDIGGTFTDIVCRRAGEPMRTLKIPTTRGDPSQAVLNAVAHLSRDLGVAAGDITRFLHGTTIATNAVLERKGAKIGLITSEGFRDILEIGYQLRQDLHRDHAGAGHAGVPRTRARNARKCREQVSAQGEVIVPLDEAVGAACGGGTRCRWRAGDRGVLPVLVPASGARAAHARADRGRRIPALRCRCRPTSIRHSANMSAPSSPRSTPT